MNTETKVTTTATFGVWSDATSYAENALKDPDVIQVWFSDRYWQHTVDPVTRYEVITTSRNPK